MAPQNDSPPKLIVASHLLSLRCSHVFIFCLLQGLLLPFRDCSCIDALAGGIGSGKVPPSFILNWTIYSEDENVVVHVSRILQSIFLLYRFVHNFTKSLVVICPSQPGWKYTIFSRTFRIKNQMLQFRWPGPQMRYWRWLVDNPHRRYCISRSVWSPPLASTIPNSEMRGNEKVVMMHLEDYCRTLVICGQ